MTDATLTLVGNVTRAPDLRYMPSGAAVAEFTIASTPRRFDKARREWVDGETLFLPCSAWRDMAEHISESLARGDRAIVTGRLKSRTYETREGEKRTVVELDVEDIGLSLRYTAARVTKAQRGEPTANAWAAK